MDSGLPHNPATCLVDVEFHRQLNQFIHSLIGLGSKGYFSSNEFRCVARVKLGVGPTNEPPGFFRVCACNKSFDASVDSLHGLSCSLNKGSRNLRYDHIRDKLYQLIKRLNRGVQQTHLSLEFEGSSYYLQSSYLPFLPVFFLFLRFPLTPSLSGSRGTSNPHPSPGHTKIFKPSSPSGLTPSLSPSTLTPVSPRTPPPPPLDNTLAPLPLLPQ
jgi:hypothetical protein